MGKVSLITYMYQNFSERSEREKTANYEINSIKSIAFFTCRTSNSALHFCWRTAYHDSAYQIPSKTVGIWRTERGVGGYSLIYTLNEFLSCNVNCIVKLAFPHFITWHSYQNIIYCAKLYLYLLHIFLKYTSS